MLSTKQCTDILGEGRVSEIIRKFKNKGINQDTIDRVLDYLACNQKVFPFLDNKLLEDRLVNNLQTSIIYDTMLQRAISTFKKTKNVGEAIRKAVKVHGTVDGNSIRIAKEKSFSFGMAANRRLDHIIRHELDHIATTSYTNSLTRSAFEQYLIRNFELSKELFKNPRQPDFSPSKVDDLYQKYGDKVRKKSGIVGVYDSNLQLGSHALNEGITEYKIKKLDKFANDGIIGYKSGYKINEKVAKYMAGEIGEEKFLNMQLNHDFVGITKSFMNATGKDEQYMGDFYKNLDIETGVEPVPVWEKLTRRFQNALNINVDKNNALIQEIKHQVELD